MKRILLVGVIAAAAAAVPALADSINIASASGTAAVTVYTPLTLTQTVGLDFGTVTSGASGGVVISSVNGYRKLNGGVGGVSADIGSAGVFVVTGQLNAAINILVGSTITGMQGITGQTQIFNLPTALNGLSATFNVGGGLQIPANTPAGVYKGSYTVTVNYP